MAEIIEFGRRAQNLKSVKDSSLRQRKIEALRKIFQCSRCMLKCAKCGTQLDKEGEETSRYATPYPFCRNAGIAQYRRCRRVANHRAQIEPILQLGKALAVVIDYRDVVFFGYQSLGDACANLPGAQNDDFHDPNPRIPAGVTPVYSSPRLPSLTSSCFSLRYRCVRSSPDRSASLVMLPPSIRK